MSRTGVAAATVVIGDAMYRAFLRHRIRRSLGITSSGDFAWSANLKRQNVRRTGPNADPRVAASAPN